MVEPGVSDARRLDLLFTNSLTSAVLGAFCEPGGVRMALNASRKAFAASYRPPG